MNTKEIAEILARKPESRYKYFIRTVAAEEEVWGLMDEEGWLMLEVEEDQVDALAVFPGPEFAELFKNAGQFEDFKVEPLDVHEFLEWLDDMTEQQLRVAVFPTPAFQCAVMKPEIVLEDFETEFAKADKP